MKTLLRICAGSSWCVLLLGQCVSLNAREYEFQNATVYHIAVRVNDEASSYVIAPMSTLRIPFEHQGESLGILANGITGGGSPDTAWENWTGVILGTVPSDNVDYRLTVRHSSSYMSEGNLDVVSTQIDSSRNGWPAAAAGFGSAMMFVAFGWVKRLTGFVAEA